MSYQLRKTWVTLPSKTFLGIFSSEQIVIRITWYFNIQRVHIWLMGLGQSGNLLGGFNERASKRRRLDCYVKFREAKFMRQQFRNLAWRHKFQHSWWNVGSINFSTGDKTGSYCSGRARVRVISNEFQPLCMGPSSALAYYHARFDRRQLLHSCGVGLRKAERIGTWSPEHPSQQNILSQEGNVKIYVYLLKRDRLPVEIRRSLTPRVGLKCVIRSEIQPIDQSKKSTYWRQGQRQMQRRACLWSRRQGLVCNEIRSLYVSGAEVRTNAAPHRTIAVNSISWSARETDCGKPLMRLRWR